MHLFLEQANWFHKQEESINDKSSEVLGNGSSSGENSFPLLLERLSFASLCLSMVVVQFAFAFHDVLNSQYIKAS